MCLLFTENAPVHPKNRHVNGYDLSSLCQSVPELFDKVITTPAGKQSIDFSDAESVRLLNAALLQQDYGILSQFFE